MKEIKDVIQNNYRFNFELNLKADGAPSAVDLPLPGSPKQITFPSAELGL